MGKSEKQIEKEKARNQRIIDTAFQIFVEKKIEAVTMEEIARKAGIGRAHFSAAIQVSQNLLWLYVLQSGRHILIS